MRNLLAASHSITRQCRRNDSEKETKIVVVHEITVFMYHHCLF